MSLHKNLQYQLHTGSASLPVVYVTPKSTPMSMARPAGGLQLPQDFVCACSLVTEPKLQLLLTSLSVGVCFTKQTEPALCCCCCRSRLWHCQVTTCINGFDRLRLSSALGEGACETAPADIAIVHMSSCFWSLQAEPALPAAAGRWGLLLVMGGLGSID